MGEYKLIEHTADIAVKIYSETEFDLFQTAFQAFNSILFTQTAYKTINKLNFILEAPDLESLLHDFLSELNFIFNSKLVIWENTADLNIIREKSKFKLECTLNYELLNNRFNLINTEIKAVTYHKFNITKNDGLHFATIVFDV